MKQCQREALSDEKFHGTAALVGSLAYFHLVTDRIRVGGGGQTKHPKISQKDWKSYPNTKGSPRNDALLGCDISTREAQGGLQNIPLHLIASFHCVFSQ